MEKNNMKRTDWLEQEVARLTQHLKQSEKKRRKQKLVYEKNMENLGLKMLEFEECLKREQDELQSTLKQKDNQIHIHGELVKALQKKLNARNCKHCDIKLNSELEWQVSLSNDVSKENNPIRQLPPLSLPLPQNLPNSSLNCNKYFRRPKSKLSPVAEESEIMFASNLRNIHADMNPQRFHAVLSASLQSIADNETFFSDSESPVLIIPNNTAEFSTPIETTDDTQTENSYEECLNEVTDNSNTVSVATQTTSDNITSECDIPDDLSTPSIPNVVHPDVVLEGENVQLESTQNSTISQESLLISSKQTETTEILDRETQDPEPSGSVDENPSSSIAEVTVENSDKHNIESDKENTDLTAALHDYCDDLSRLTLSLVSKEVNEGSIEISKVDNRNEQLYLYSASFVADSINNALNDLTAANLGDVPIITIDDCSNQNVSSVHNSIFSDKVPDGFNTNGPDTCNQISDVVNQIVESIIPSISNSNIVELVKKGLNKPVAEPAYISEKTSTSIETSDEKTDDSYTAIKLSENANGVVEDQGGSAQHADDSMIVDIPKTDTVINEEPKFEENDTAVAIAESFNEEVQEGENEEKEIGGKKKKKKKKKRKKRKSTSETNNRESFESSDSHSFDSSSSAISSTVQFNADDITGSYTADGTVQEPDANGFNKKTIQTDMENNDQFIVISLDDNEGNTSKNSTNTIADIEVVSTHVT